MRGALPVYPSPLNSISNQFKPNLICNLLESEIMNTIKKKISALIAKANSSDNKFESELFLSKANELMEKHQISNWDLNIDDPIIDQEFLFGSSGITSWKVNLLSATAQFYGATVTQRKQGRKTWLTLIGKESACVTVELMFPYLITQVTKQAKLLRHKGVDSRLQFLKRKVANSLYFRIIEIVKSRKSAPIKNDAVTKNNLIVKNQLDVFVQNKFPNLGKGRKSKITTSKAAEQAAKNISLNLQATNDQTIKAIEFKDFT